MPIQRAGVEEGPVSVDVATFRGVLSAVPTSVAIVTAGQGTEPCGMVVGSLASLSLEPPLVLFCVARRARSHPALCAAERYCISVLADDQAVWIDRFVSRSPDRFQQGMFDLDGLPAVTGAAAWLVGSRDGVLVAGDHSIVIARVERAEAGSASPMLYVGRSYRSLLPRRAPSAVGVRQPGGSAMDQVVGGRPA